MHDALPVLVALVVFEAVRTTLGNALPEYLGAVGAQLTFTLFGRLRRPSPSAVPPPASVTIHQLNIFGPATSGRRKRSRTSSTVSFPTALEVFYAEHRLCGEPKVRVRFAVLRMVCDCGASMAHRIGTGRRG